VPVTRHLYPTDFGLSLKSEKPDND
jgi:hypothetical protein